MPGGSVFYPVPHPADGDFFGKCVKNRMLHGAQGIRQLVKLVNLVPEIGEPLRRPWGRGGGITWNYVKWPVGTDGVALTVAIDHEIRDRKPGDFGGFW